MFDDIKNYVNLDNSTKTCALCKDGRPLKTWTTCDSCGQYFCYNHRPMFEKQWICPLCKENFSNFTQPLKESNVQEFLKRLG